MPQVYQEESAQLAAPVVADGVTHFAHLRSARDPERGGPGPNAGPIAVEPGRSALIPGIKRSISDFYEFAKEDRAFPPFPAHFAFEERRLRVRFPSLVGAGFLEKADQFCSLLATIAGLLGVSSHGRPDEMKELLMMAVGEKELIPTESPLPRLGLRIVGANMAEIWFESEKL
jgi:hypothetical protein